jgi:hypothetical protein
MTDQVEPGVELILVGREGRFGGGVVESVDFCANCEIAQLFTSVGDIKVPISSSIITRQGLRPVGSLETGTDAGPPRVELVRPTDLPHEQRRRRVSKDDIRAALGCLDPPVVMIPAVRPDLDELIDRISDHLERASVAYALEETDRWTTFLIGRLPASGGKDLRCQGQVLSDLTAWTSADSVLSRTRLSDDRARRRSIAGLVAGGADPLAQWFPAYRPVECHVSEQKAWKPFSPVPSIRRIREGSIRVTVAGRGKLICGLAVVGAS